MAIGIRSRIRGDSLGSIHAQPPRDHGWTAPDASWESLIRLVALGLLFAAFVFIAPLAAPQPAGPTGVQLVRFGGGHFGGGGFGARPSFRRPSFGGLGRRAPRRSHHILRRIGRALAFAAVLHFLFAGSHGLGFLLFLVLIVGAVVLIMRRRQRRAYPRI